MTDPKETLAQAEEQLAADAKRTFGSFFRWVGFLDDTIKKDIGPQFGAAVSPLDVSVVEQKVSGALDVSRPMKQPLSIPFQIQGETITLSHSKFEREDALTGETSSAFDLATIDDVNRILGDIVQDYIG